MPNYTIFIDESGDFKRKEPFIIGGYIIEHGNNVLSTALEQKIDAIIPKDELKTGYEADYLAYHRTDFKRALFEEAIQFTHTLFDEFTSIDEKDLKFHSFFYTEIANKKIKDIKSTGVLYVRLLVNLAVKNCLDIVKRSSKAKDKINIHIVAAIRQESNDNYRIIKLPEYSEYMQYVLDELSTKYGISNDKISIALELKSASMQGAYESKKSGELIPFDARLTVADYFTNVCYGRKKHKDKEIYQKYNEAGKIIFSPYFKDDLDIELYSYNRDYYNLLKLYLNYKIYHPQQTDEIDRLTKAIEIRPKTRDNVYFVPSVISILHFIEQESTRDKDYGKIIKIYDTLIDFIETLHHKEYFYLRFLVCREKLAVCNHSGNAKLAKEMITECELLEEELKKDFKYYPDLFIYYSLCDNSLNSLYQSKHILDQGGKRLAIYEHYYSTIPNASKEDLGRFYGSLGTAHIYQYLVDKSEETALNAEKWFQQSLEFLSEDQQKRTYTNMLHLYRHTNNTEKWMETLYLSLDATQETIMEKINEEFFQFQDRPSDTSFGFLFRELLIYATYKKDSMPLVLELRQFIIGNCQKYIREQKQDGDPGISIHRDFTVLHQIVCGENLSADVRKQREYFNSIKKEKKSLTYPNIYDGLKALSLELVEQLLNKQYAVKSAINRYQFTDEHRKALSLPAGIIQESEEAIRYYLNSIYT